MNCEYCQQPLQPGQVHEFGMSDCVEALQHSLTSYNEIIVDQANEVRGYREVTHKLEARLMELRLENEALKEHVRVSGNILFGDHD